MTTQQTEAEFDAYSETYRKTVNQSLPFSMKVDYFTRVKMDYLGQLVTRHFGNDAKPAMLDVGCGVGTSHSLMRKAAGRLAGVDVSPASIAQAQIDNPGIDYSAYDGTTLPFDDNSFDAATATCVMHHVPPELWPNFLSEMKRILRPGGLLVIFEHNPLNPLTLKVVSDCEFDADAVLLRRGKMQSLVDAAGYRDVQTRTILSIPSFGAVTRAVDLALGRIGLGAQYFVRAVV